MIISADVRVPFARPLVFTTCRDKLVEIAHYMPNVRQIKVQSRQQDNQLVRCVYEWHGGGEIPGAARAVLSDDILTWTEYNTADETTFTVDWQIKTHAFTKAVRCYGKNRFIQDGEATLIQSRGELAIDPRQVEGVPSFLVGMIVGLVEDFLAKTIEPNLIEMGNGIRQYLDRETLEQQTT
jgi:hypothetical protein